VSASSCDPRVSHFAPSIVHASLTPSQRLVEQRHCSDRIPRQVAMTRAAKTRVGMNARLVCRVRCHIASRPWCRPGRRTCARTHTRIAPSPAAQHNDRRGIEFVYAHKCTCALECDKLTEGGIELVTEWERCVEGLHLEWRVVRGCVATPRMQLHAPGMCSAVQLANTIHCARCFESYGNTAWRRLELTA
jgi:hypothetical protein